MEESNDGSNLDWCEIYQEGCFQEMMHELRCKASVGGFPRKWGGPSCGEVKGDTQVVDVWEQQRE